jgi:hypothetical protein
MKPLPRATQRPSISSSRALIERYQKVPHKKHRACRICAAPLGAATIDLPKFPMTEIYVPRAQTRPLAILDQSFCFCERCGHGQLTNTIPADFLYGSNYFTRTSNSSAKTAIDDFLKFVKPQLPARRMKSILEIGCNDLYMLSELKDRAETLCGIDPIWKGREQETSTPKLRVIGAFIEEVDATRLVEDRDVVLCSHTLEHIDDPLSLLRSLVAGASSKTRFFFQFPGLDPLVKDGRFDQLHHQHLNYFTLQSAIAALEKAGAELLSYEFNYYHWGALMISFRKRSGGATAKHRKLGRSVERLTGRRIRDRYALFRQSMKAINAQLRQLRATQKVYGFGAALMLPLLAYHIPEIAKLECIIDDDPEKQGLYYINFPLKIVPAGRVKNLGHSAIAVTAINSKQNVRALTRKLIDLQVKDIFIPTHVL